MICSSTTTAFPLNMSTEKETAVKSGCSITVKITEKIILLSHFCSSFRKRSLFLWSLLKKSFPLNICRRSREVIWKVWRDRKMANSVVPAKLFCHHPFRIAQIQTHEEKKWAREREKPFISTEWRLSTDQNHSAAAENWPITWH